METYGIVVSTFSVLDKDNKKRFFEESFLLAEVKPDIVLGMLFFTMSNVDVAQDLQWKYFTTGDVFPTTRQVKLIRKKKFAIAVLDLKYEAFIIYVIAFSIYFSDKMHPSKKAQIAYLKVDEAPTKVPNKYTDFTNVFSVKLIAKLRKHTEINDHTIKLVDDRQLLYNHIYSLGPVKLETLKVYIKNNLVNNLIRPFKSPARVLIFLDKKPDDSLRLCVDY